MQHCHIAPLLGTLGKKWMTHIMATFSSNGAMTFGDIKREFNFVNSSLISQRLKELQEYGLILKQEEKYIPTEKLMYFKSIFRDINNWH